MTSLDEGDLRLTPTGGAIGRRFDHDATHELSHCMKAVDFIVELDDRVLFIEFKDPENPNARDKNSNKFVEKFLSGTLDGDLTAKFRDTFLYEWACNRMDKPIYYLVLIALSRLDAAALMNRTDSLRRRLPVRANGASSWMRPLVEDCAVMNLETWNRSLPHLPISRLSP
jgi:hypothetical protein